MGAGNHAVTAARFVLSALAMLSISPSVAVATLVLWSPERWSGSADPLSILAMTVFGLVTVPLWPTFIPALFLTPLVLEWVSRFESFRTLPLRLFLLFASLAGFAAGAAVISIIVPWGEPFDLILNWLMAGAISGAATLPAIALLYRFGPERAQAAAFRDASPPSP